MLFLLIKWIHILSAITAVGANITYGIWISRAMRVPDVMPFVLHTIKVIDDRVANPLYILQVFTGLTMVFMLQLSLTTPWILSALILYSIAGVLGLAAFVPVFRREIEYLEREGINSPGFKRAAKQSRVLGAIVGIDVLIIIFLMVVKPPLWG